MLSAFLTSAAAAVTKLPAARSRQISINQSHHSHILKRLLPFVILAHASSFHYGLHLFPSCHVLDAEGRATMSYGGGGRGEYYKNKYGGGGGGRGGGGGGGGRGGGGGGRGEYYKNK